jgi:DNA-binding NtrC family response regulator
MLPGPPELEERCRRFLEGRGDAVAPLFRFVRGGGGRAGSGAWAALIISRIFLLKGNIGLAQCYLRLAAARSGTRRGGDARNSVIAASAESRDAALRLGILVNRALILKAQGNIPRASALLRAIVDRALREGETFVAAKAAANLALCMARGGEAQRADSYLGLAERAYAAAGYETGRLRLSLIRALVESKRGRHEEAIDATVSTIRECGEERYARERAAGVLLLAELFLEKGNLAAAREALGEAASMRGTLARFAPQRLTLLRLEEELEGASRGPDARRARSVVSTTSVGREAAACYAAAASADAGPRDAPEAFLTCDPRTAGMLEEIERAAALPFPVLIEGESGTGKEIVARLVHVWSGRGREPFVPVNAAAVPAELFESVFFGHARGSFTGAVERRAGLAAAAGRGTLFLDEIGELCPALQAKLLRLVDRKEFIPLGETKPKRFEARIVAATNRDLRVECTSGRFRADLYHRLAPLAFRIPPLRERPADIELLAGHFARRLSGLPGIGPAALHGSAIAALERHPLPGNARELESEILRGALAAGGGTIRACHLSPDAMKSALRVFPSPPAGLAARLDSLERDAILEALRECGGNRTNAARRLGLKRTTLLGAMRRLGIEF